MGQFSDLGGIMALQGFAQLHSFLLKILNKNVQQFPKKPFIILNSFQKLIDVQDFHVHCFLSRAGCKLVPDTLTLITMAKILNKATTIVKTTMQAVMINDQSLVVEAHDLGTNVPDEHQRQGDRRPRRGKNEKRKQTGDQDNVQIVQVDVPFADLAGGDPD